ncbi:hypothetical protein CHELA1G11_12123 [Hyphomicrobiales bacterium]|nr:hypothetical protein CHELA1G11_12123 [Hyphomicrobiales bacterium]CAH1663142.1 hypothetical protein CHELA1G2_12190 [Hyphomicrobiales bacterium]
MWKIAIVRQQLREMKDEAFPAPFEKAGTLEARQSDLPTTDILHLPARSGCSMSSFDAREAE